jgi:hypothetical protein
MRIDALLQGQNINLSNLSSILDRVHVGDVIRAQILEISTDAVILKLFDGSTISASISENHENIDAKPGEFVDFKVKENSEKKAFLELLKNSGIKALDSSTEINRQIKAIGINPDNASIEIANELKNNSVPISKGNFEKMLDIMSSFMEINPEKAAFIIANKIGAEEKNITALKQLTDEKVKISQSLDKILSFIDNIDDESLVKSIADNMLKGKNEVIGNKPELVHLLQNHNLSSEQITDEAITERIKNLIKNSLNSKSVQNMSQEDIDILEKVNLFFENIDNDVSNLKDKFTNFIERSFSAQGKSSKDLQGQASTLIKDILSILTKSEEMENQHELENNSTKTDNYKKEIRSMLDKLHIDVNSENLKEELNVKSLYKDLYSKLEAIKDTLQASNLSNKADIISNIEHSENNIRFMNQLNSYNSYIQIPLNIWNRNTTGEIYVLKRDSKKRKIDPENATMLISLDTENLGQVDTFLNVNKKNISVSMRVEDNKLIEFIKGYHKELYKRMSEKGYKLVDLKFRIPEEDISLINVNKLAEKEFKPGNVSIDYRL